MKKITLILSILFLFSSQSYSRQTPHNFPVGIFNVTDEETGFLPGTQSFANALLELNDGSTTSSYEAINLIQIYRNADKYNSTAQQIYENVLTDAHNANIEVLINISFRAIDRYYGDIGDRSDGLLNSSQETRVIQDIKWILDQQHTTAIGGWYIADEPENSKDFDGDGINEYPAINASELKKLSNLIKSTINSDPDGAGVNQDIYISQAAGFNSTTSVAPSKNYTTYLDSWDVLIVNWYHYSANRENENIDIITNNWNPHITSSNIGYGTLRGWNYIHDRLKDISGYPGNITGGKRVFANLVLGEQHRETFPGGNDYKTYNPDVLATHEITHAAIKKVYDMGFDGIMFYDYISSTPDVSGNPINEFREDAKGHWLVNENYAEAVQTEIHDRDWLITAFSNSSGSDNRTYLSNRGSSFLNTASGPCYNVTGQCPGSGYNKGTGNTVVTHLSTGDLFGEVNADLTYIINNNSDRKSVADGDDELVWVTEDGDFWISEANHVNSGFGSALNSDQNANSTEEITALTTGDFDGDGDYEVATAVYTITPGYPYIIYKTSIYLSYDGLPFKQSTPVYTYSHYASSLVPRITAMAAGDFDGSGRDKLITAAWYSGLSDNKIYLSDIANQQSPLNSPNILYNNTNTNTYISNFAVGDFDGDFEDELASVEQSSTGSWNALYISKPKSGGGPGNPLHGSNRVWSSSSEKLTAITAGDFKGERRDYLITGFWNSNTNKSNIYQSIPWFDSNGYGEGNPTVTSNSGTDHIYANGTYWHPTAMASGSFRESGAGLSSKVIAGPVTTISETPTEVSLSQNYPNPFNPITTINYTIKDRSEVSVNVYNLLGRKVASLVNEVKEPGTYSVQFDGSNLSSGIYFYELRSGTTVLKEKMTLIK